MSLNYNSDVPLYIQLKDAIKAAIKDETFPNKEKIPTEKELEKQFLVSRITVRRAIDELCQENYLVKKQGKGTFVKRKKVERRVEPILSFAEACKANNRVASRLLVNKIVTEASYEDAKAMNIDIGDKVILIERVNMADKIPVIFESNIFSYSEFSFLLEEDLTDSLYDILKNKYNIKIKYSRNAYIEVSRASKSLAKNLNTIEGEPLLFSYFEIYDVNEKLVHIGRDYMIGEQYRMYLDDYERN